MSTLIGLNKVNNELPFIKIPQNYNLKFAILQVCPGSNLDSSSKIFTITNHNTIYFSIQYFLTINIQFHNLVFIF